MTTKKWTPIARSALHGWHTGHGATFTNIGAWQVPARYRPVEDELAGVRGSAGICDISLVGKLRLQGKGLSAQLKTAFPNFPGLTPGKMMEHKLAATGELPIRVAALTAEDALVITTPGQSEAVLKAISAVPSDCAHGVDVTSVTAMFRIMGPHARNVLSAVVLEDIGPAAFPDMSVIQGRIADVHGILLHADAKSGPAYSLYVSRDYAEYMWEELIETGHATPFGMEAHAKLA
ncbi:MAG: aminomethyl transferase family protein [SAR202 cluster bacterium]|nr:aminomethyl transferase family protein [SAR202 cluster bacterium]